MSYSYRLESFVEGIHQDQRDSNLLIPLFDSFQDKFFRDIEKNITKYSLTDFLRERKNLPNPDKYYLVSDGKIIKAEAQYVSLFESGDSRYEFARNVIFSGNTEQALRIINEMKKATSEFDLDAEKKVAKAHLEKIGIHNLPTSFSDFYFPNRAT